MKDKLVKTGHKKNYYKMKKIFHTSIFVLALMAVSAAPVAITYAVYMVDGNRSANAGINTNDVNTENSEEYPSYSSSISE